MANVTRETTVKPVEFGQFIDALHAARGMVLETGEAWSVIHKAGALVFGVARQRDGVPFGWVGDYQIEPGPFARLALFSSNRRIIYRRAESATQTAGEPYQVWNHATRTAYLAIPESMRDCVPRQWIPTRPQ
jgi:hypothetical protein